MIMTGIALLLPAILGFLIITLLLSRGTGTGLLERLCLAYPLGMGLLTVQMFLLALVRIPLTLGFAAAPVVLEIAVLYAVMKRKKIPLAGRLSFDLLRDIFSADNHRLKRAALAILTVMAGAKLGSVVLETYLRPIFAWDAFANWSAGAKVFYHSHTLLLDVPPSDFFGKGVLDRNANYPPLNPLLQVWTSLWTGNFDEVFAKFWSPFYLLSAAVYLYLVASRETSRLIALVMLVLFLGSPLIAIHAVEPYSDLPLATSFLFALIAFLYAMRGKNEFWPVAGLFSAVALFTKDEATFFVVPLLLSVALFLRHSNMPAHELRKALIPLALSLLVAMPWFVFKFTHSLGFGADYIKVTFTFHPEMAVRVAQLLLMPNNFNVVFIFFPILLIVNGRPTREFVFLLAPVACYALFFVSVYSLTGFYAGGLMFNTAVFRNILTYYPAVSLLTVLLIKNIISKSSSSPVMAG